MTKPSPTRTRAKPTWRQRLDQFGIGLAGLCAVHCVAAVLIVSGMGVGGHFLLAPAIHEIGLALAVMAAALAIGWGAWRHRRPTPVLVALVGLGFMTAALLAGHGPQEAVLTIIGVAIVSVGHVLNMRGFGHPAS